MNSEALIELGKWLRTLRFQFTAVTPKTHAAIKRKLENGLAADTNSLRAFLGWNISVTEDSVPREVLGFLDTAGKLKRDGLKVRSQVCVATLGDGLFMHSPFPTDAEDSVFFGPDSYRFVTFVRDFATSAKSIVDIGCGSGVGALSLALMARADSRPIPTLHLCDINKNALSFARINAAINGVQAVSFYECEFLDKVPSGADLIIANPPFMMDPKGRAYRNGNELFGGQISVDMVKASLKYAEPGTAMAMYTAGSVIDGQNMLAEEAKRLLRACEVEFSIQEIDPDIFGEELESELYRKVERIAATGIYFRR